MESISIFTRLTFSFEKKICIVLFSLLFCTSLLQAQINFNDYPEVQELKNQGASLIGELEYELTTGWWQYTQSCTSLRNKWIPQSQECKRADYKACCDLQTYDFESVVKPTLSKTTEIIVPADGSLFAMVEVQRGEGIDDGIAVWNFINSGNDTKTTVINNVFKNDRQIKSPAYHNVKKGDKVSIKIEARIDRRVGRSDIYPQGAKVQVYLIPDDPVDPENGNIVFGKKKNCESTSSSESYRANSKFNLKANFIKSCMKVHEAEVSHNKEAIRKENIMKTQSLYRENRRHNTEMARLNTLMGLPLANPAKTRIETAIRTEEAFHRVNKTAINNIADQIIRYHEGQIAQSLKTLSDRCEEKWEERCNAVLNSNNYKNKYTTKYSQSTMADVIQFSGDVIHALGATIEDVIINQGKVQTTIGNNIIQTKGKGELTIENNTIKLNDKTNNHIKSKKKTSSQYLQDIQFSTKHAKIKKRGTEFLINTTDDMTQVCVIDGLVIVSPIDDECYTVDVAAGQCVTVNAQGSISDYYTLDLDQQGGWWEDWPLVVGIDDDEIRKIDGGIIGHFLDGLFDVEITAMAHKYTTQWMVFTEGSLVDIIPADNNYPYYEEGVLSAFIDAGGLFVYNDCSTGSGVAECDQIFVGTLSDQIVSGTFAVNGENSGTWTMRPAGNINISNPADSSDINDSPISNAVGQPCGPDKEFVRSLYQSVLERDLEVSFATGYGGAHMRDLQNGESRLATILAFFNSPEYINKQKSSQEFVRDAYQSVLGREPSVTEANQWSGTNRNEIIKKLYDSKEYKNIRAGCPEIGPLSILKDDFSSALDNWDVSNITTELLDGRLFWQEGNHNGIYSIKKIPLENVIIEFDGWTTANGIGIEWKDGDNNGYNISLGAYYNTASHIGRIENGKYDWSIIKGAHIKTSAWQHYKLIQEGQTLKAYLDDQLIGEYVMNTSFGGQGQIRFSSYNSRVGIDNVHIYNTNGL